MSNRLTHGVGYNSKGKYKTKSNRKPTTAYRTWFNMLERCYSQGFHSRQPAYIGCAVSEDWHDFQSFAEWFECHEYSNLGYQLDKDLLIPNNKIYSPDTCCFIPSELNKLLVNCNNNIGEHPKGVDFQPNANKFRAQIRIDGVRVHLGLFDCANDAHQAYVSTKEAHVKLKAAEWRDRISKDVFDALVSWRYSA